MRSIRPGDYAAARSGREDVVRALLENGADVRFGHLGGNALTRAAESGHANLVRFLAQRGVDVNAAYDDVQHSALHVAAMRGHVETVRALIETGADVNAKTTEGKTPLMYAVQVNDREVLLSNEMTRRGRGEGSRVEVARLLLEAGATRDAVDENGDTALEIARRSGHVSLITLLDKR